MIAVIISVVLLVILILIAIRLISLKRPAGGNIGEEIDLGTSGPLIHASGIYSIVRKSPREDLQKIRPPEAEIRKYLASINEDITNKAISHFDKPKLIENWLLSREENVRVVEQGDTEDVEFYYLDFQGGKECPVCTSYFRRGQFVSRQEIFKHPSIVPPFHIGCSTKLVPYHGKENLRETTILGMLPLFSTSAPPPLPDWKRTVKNL